MYDNERAIAYWDVPLYVCTTLICSNKIDVTIIDKKNKKQFSVLEVNCPWVENREVKDNERTAKYSQLRLELMNRYPGYQVLQCNIIIDVLGGYSREVEHSIKELISDNSKTTILRTQKAILKSSLHVARHFKLNC